MEPESSLPYSQAPATCPYPEQIDPVHTLTFHFLKIHLIIILLSSPGSSKWSLSLRFPHQNPVYISTAPIRVTCPIQLIFLDLITRKISDVGAVHRAPHFVDFSIPLFPHPS